MACAVFHARNFWTAYQDAFFDARFCFILMHLYTVQLLIPLHIINTSNLISKDTVNVYVKLRIELLPFGVCNGMASKAIG